MQINLEFFLKSIAWWTILGHLKRNAAMQFHFSLYDFVHNFTKFTWKNKTEKIPWNQYSPDISWKQIGKKNSVKLSNPFIIHRCVCKSTSTYKTRSCLKFVKSTLFSNLCNWFDGKNLDFSVCTLRKLQNFTATIFSQKFRQIKSNA